MLNDGYADLARRHPDRIASYVMLPLPFIDTALREMERGLDQLGCVGVNMHISCLNRSVAETEFEPIYQEMNRRGSILFVHPSVTGICSPFITDYGYTASVGTSLEDATFVLHMIAKQIPHRFPNIKFIVPHLGGPIPMLLNRLDKQGRRDHPNLAEAPNVTAQTVLVRHRMLRLEGRLHLRPRSLWRGPPDNRQRLSGVAGLRGVQGHFRLYRAAWITPGRCGQDPAP
jgi:6-methylsalicylate decarboxylase